MIINLTPHNVHVRLPDGTFKDFPASGKVARCTEKRISVGYIEGITTYKVEYGDVVDLPDEDGTDDAAWYIVSMPVRLALPDRSDLVSPGVLLRDETGNVVGCDGFAINY